MGGNCSQSARDSAQLSSTPETKAINAQRQQMINQSMFCGAILLISVLLLIYLYWYYDVIKSNSDGWVLYYSPVGCGFSRNFRDDMIKRGWWKLMAKVDCEKEPWKCPYQVQTVPTWVNKYTGMLSDNPYGIFR